MLEIGQNIYSARLRRAMTQSALAEATGIPQPNLSKVERGQKDLTVSTLMRIARALDLKPGELLEADRSEARPPISLSRPVIEKLARAVVEKGVRLDASQAELVRLLRLLVPRPGRAPSIKKTQAAWLKLKDLLGRTEIRAVLERVRDATQRAA